MSLKAPDVPGRFLRFVRPLAFYNDGHSHELSFSGTSVRVRAGTNLSMVRLAAEMERTLSKPVIAINTATDWHALRANGIGDRLDGFGHLMARA